MQHYQHLNLHELSPYYLMTSDEENSAVQKLEEQLLISTLPPVAGGRGVPFSFLADNLERAYHATALLEKQNIAYNLVHEVLQSATDKPELELLALLRLCLPSHDNRSVYGFKTYRLIKSFAKAFEKCGGNSGRAASSYLLQWLRRPEPVKQKRTLITMPEIAVAHAHALCFPSTTKKTHALSIRDIAALCQHLTNMYKEKHKELVVAATMDEHGANKEIAGIKVDKVAEFLSTVIPYLGYLESKILVRVLLRTVSMGIGMKTFTKAILGGAMENRLNHQMDLGRLSINIVNAGMDEKQAIKNSTVTILCGVPFRSMTCQVVSSPYVMKWLFSREESIKSYLPPKDGKLIMHSNGRWYIPLKRSNSIQRKRFIDLDTRDVMASKYTKKHMELLREIMRNRKKYFREEMAFGMVISYIITKSEDNQQHSASYLFLIRAMKSIEDEQIEFMDTDVVYDTAVASTEPSKSTTKTNEKMRGLISQLIISNAPLITPAYHVTVCSLDDDNEKRKTSSNTTGGDSNKGMIVQRKYDGDRMQAHIGLSQDEKPKVQLFSKSGKPVQHLYTDVAKEISQKLIGELQHLRGDLPCILDGEIIVVDKNQCPLPWSSAKWRYDSGKGGASLLNTSGQQQGSIPTIVSLINETGYCENLEDGEGTDISLAPLTSLKVWDQLGSNEKKKIHVKVLEPGARLQFVVFDMLMLGGRVITDQPYSHRLKKLKELRLFTSSKLAFTKVISESHYIQNADDLVKQLVSTVREKAEGLILKDPRAKYVFGRTNSQRKLKICGPDINCEVVGLGFTLSKNPRMWGILTAIMSDDKQEFLVYNRVESIEGDAPDTAAEHILSLPGSVSVDALRALVSGYRGSNSGEVDVGKYTLLVTTNQAGENEDETTDLEDVIRVTWKPKNEDDVTHGCTLCFMHGLPNDIHWLCNPFESLFSVSQRGDLHPLSWEGGMSQPISVRVPRFPVCRIQLNDHQRSECDTPSSIKEKFDQACAEPTCIQEFLKRRVVQLRSKPPRAEKLEELRRILLGRRNQTETWPQEIDTLYKLEDFSKILVENGFEPLTQGERHVLCGLQPRSQWDQFLVKKVKIIDSEEVMESEEERKMNLPFLVSRLSKFKRMLDEKKLLRPTVTKSRMNFTAIQKKDVMATVSTQTKTEIKIMEDLISTIPLIPPCCCKNDEDEDDDVEEEEEDNLNTSIPAVFEREISFLGTEKDVGESEYQNDFDDIGVNHGMATMYYSEERDEGLNFEQQYWDSHDKESINYYDHMYNE